MGHHFNILGRIHTGEVSEWFKELVLKTSDSERDRGFESHPLRHKISESVCELFSLEKYSRG